MVDLRAIRAIFYDFDGVMTNNMVYIMQNGEEAVVANRGDGYAIAKIKEMGIPQIIVSTEENPVVEKRALKVGLPVIQGVKDKADVIKKYSEENGIDLKKAAFIGNDINDMSAFCVCGIKIAPADAEVEILEIADWISEKKGGYGVIRDLYRQITNGRKLDQ